jgi:hypothetical protein
MRLEWLSNGIALTTGPKWLRIVIPDFPLPPDLRRQDA